MLGSDLFISSCSRRQLARRRSSRSVLRLQFRLAELFMLAAAAAFVVGRGGF
jgi:hypothetical protein